MKYIRTKNGEIHEFLEEGINNAIISTKGCVIMKYAITKQANTIEELCDEFVVCETNTSKNITYNHNYQIGMLEEYMNKVFPFKPTYITLNFIRGAVWTEKGLIYVAKMNEKGEFELL